MRTTLYRAYSILCLFLFIILLIFLLISFSSSVLFLPSVFSLLDLVITSSLLSVLLVLWFLGIKVPPIIENREDTSLSDIGVLVGFPCALSLTLIVIPSVVYEEISQNTLFPENPLFHAVLPALSIAGIILSFFILLAHYIRTRHRLSTLNPTRNV